ncbi:MAG TPA: hypothetical protein VGI46_13895 [Candidatus Acidoferrum sp.]|jgi:hypothetical protein
MPRVVPSQVVQFIDQIFPWASRQREGEMIGIQRGESGLLTGLLNLV